MNSYQDPNQPLFQLNLDAENSYMLRSAASWARILGVTGIICGLIMAGFAVYMLIVFGDPNYEYGNNKLVDEFNTNDGKASAIFILIVGLVFFLGGFFSFLFGKRIVASLRLNNQEGVNNAFLQLRNYFATRGITMILLLLLLVLGILGSTLSDR
jgi:hypothetical protein